MSSREIIITPSKITVDHLVNVPEQGFSYWTRVFDTGRFYLMTDPAGNLRAGGYERCPTFYGISTDPNTGITDKDNGWWPTDVIRGGIGYTTNNLNFYLDIPRWDNYKQVVSKPIRQRYYYSPYNNIFHHSGVGQGACGSFRWIAAEVYGGTGSDENGNPAEYYEFRVWPTEVVLWNQNIEGIIRFPYTTALDNFTGPWGAVFGNLRYTTYDEYGNSGTASPYPNPQFNNSCLMFLKNPTTLSVAVSP